MRESWIKQLFKRATFEDGISRDRRTDNLIRSAQRHFAGDFPNLHQHDCPQSEELLRLIRQHQFPGPDLLGHLLSCSNCFRDYQEALTAQREASPEIKTSSAEWFTSTFLRPKALAVGFAMLVLVFSTFAVIVWVRDHRTSEATIALSGPPPSAADSSSPATQPSQKGLAAHETIVKPPDRLEVPSKRSTDMVASAYKVNIDLESSNPSRGVDQNHAPDVVLASRYNDLMIRLPTGSPTGSYKIGLVDPFGNPIRSSVASSRQGSTLQVSLNLISVPAGKYLLCVGRKSEVPDCVQAEVPAP